MYQKNLQHVEKQIASCGGEMRSSLELRNQKDDLEVKIDEIESQIEELEKVD
jgi:hypothetical protein